MSLDALTERGQGFIRSQCAIIEQCAASWACEAVHMAGHATPIDALFTRAGTLFRVGEIKTRPDLTLRHLRGLGSYLVTFDKLVNGRDLAVRLNVDYVLVVGLPDALVWWWVSDAVGAWRSQMRVARTTTQATCNGGEAERANAYLSLGDMRVEAVR